MNPLFVYGTLRPGQYNYRCVKGYSEHVETCRTADEYVLFTQKYKAFPYMIPADYWPEAKSSYVIGDLLKVGRAGIEQTDRLEGYNEDRTDNWYERKIINIVTSSGVTNAYVYLLSKTRFDEMTKEDYIVITGVLSNSVAESQMQLDNCSDWKEISED
jgi:gamma-glutamylcyclotransferase (GGCT)/AIG2-like uncharacterized protein YtfP